MATPRRPRLKRPWKRPLKRQTSRTLPRNFKKRQRKRLLRKSTGPTTDDGHGAEENICIDLMTDTGKVDDKSFNQAAWEGTQLAAEQVGGFAKYIETLTRTMPAASVG